MSSLYKRADESQRRILRAVEGAVKNTGDAHPHYGLDKQIARSIAKRAAGTLTAQWPDVLAARSVSSNSADPETVPSGRPLVAKGSKQSGRRASYVVRRSPLPAIWKQLTILVGEAKRAGQIERATGLIDALRIVAAAQRAATAAPSAPATLS